MEKGEFIVSYHKIFGYSYKLASQIYEWAKVRDRELVADVIRELYRDIDFNPLITNLAIAYWNDKMKFVASALLIPLIALGVLMWISGTIILV